MKGLVIITLIEDTFVIFTALPSIVRGTLTTAIISEIDILKPASALLAISLIIGDVLGRAV